MKRVLPKTTAVIHAEDGKPTKIGLFKTPDGLRWFFINKWRKPAAALEQGARTVRAAQKRAELLWDMFEADWEITEPGCKVGFINGQLRQLNPLYKYKRTHNLPKKGPLQGSTIPLPYKTIGESK